jgi:hypothetical protein
MPFNNHIPCVCVCVCMCVCVGTQRECVGRALPELWTEREGQTLWVVKPCRIFLNPDSCPGCISKFGFNRDRKMLLGKPSFLAFSVYVTFHVIFFLCVPKHTQTMVPPLWLNAVSWSWLMLDWFHWFCLVLQCHKQRCALFPGARFLCRC